jgi:ferrochelatase
MIGVLLLNMGGPDTLKAVRPFLYNLFSDRRIIRLGPPFLQKPLARLISVIRYKKTEKMYRVIGGRSPLLTITKAQAEALAISLFPHYSLATSGSAISKFEETVRECPLDYRIVPSWHDHHLYIESLCDVIAKGIDSFGGEGAEVLFSAHSLPVSIIESGDPYALHIEGTILEVAKRVGIRWHLSYQSRSGPVKWLRPSTEEKIRELAAAGVKNLLVVPVSFVSDHIETLFEIDVSYSNLAGALGVRLRRAESLNTHPVFIRALRELVLTGISESGWRQC